MAKAIKPPSTKKADTSPAKPPRAPRKRAVAKHVPVKENLDPNSASPVLNELVQSIREGVNDFRKKAVAKPITPSKTIGVGLHLTVPTIDDQEREGLVKEVEEETLPDKPAPKAEAADEQAPAPVKKKFALPSLAGLFNTPLPYLVLVVLGIFISARIRKCSETKAIYRHTTAATKEADSATIYRLRGDAKDSLLRLLMAGLDKSTAKTDSLEKEARKADLNAADVESRASAATEQARQERAWFKERLVSGGDAALLDSALKSIYKEIKK